MNWKKKMVCKILMTVAEILAQDADIPVKLIEEIHNIKTSISVIDEVK